MLQIENLSFAYGAALVFDEVNMDIPEGKVTCIIGRNGVGKTTLLMSIMGILDPTTGSIRLGDIDLTRLAPEARARAGLGLVPQGRRIFPRLTVEENLKIGLEGSSEKVTAIPEETYELFPILKTMSDRMGGDLSGGQQQQLAIARALVGRPKVLMLDEPTEGIQPNVIQEIGQVLRRLVDELNITVVMVEQYLAFVQDIGHQFYLMGRRGIVAEGATADLTSELIHQHLQV
jgi:urea transport system ATP-binding protein